MKVCFDRPSRRTWAKLRREANRLGLVVFAKATVSLKALQEQFDELTDEAAALQKLMESDEGLTDEQTSRWDELMDDDKGEIAVVGNKLQAAKRLEGEKKKLAALRLAAVGGSPFSRGGRGPSGNVDDDAPKAPAIRISGSRKLVCFKGENAREDAYNSGMYLRAIRAQSRNKIDREAEAHLERIGWDVQATATEGSPTESGYLVPEPLQAAFIERRQQVGVMRALARFEPMGSNTLEVPKLVSGPAVVYPGEATAPAALASQVWAKVRLETVKRMVLGKLSKELKADALIDVVDQFVSRTAYEFAKQEDNEAINGDGTATYGREVGILAALGAAGVATAATGHDTWLELDIADFVSAMGILPSDYWTQPAWVCSAAFYHIAMLRVMASAGGNSLQTIETGAGVKPSFLGYPVFFTDRMRQTTAAATVCCLFGSFADAIMLGDRQAFEMEMSDDAYFAEDVTAVKATTRIDFNVHEAGDASNAGAVVAVKTAA
jgi:HK97 family phage major capsid protein